MSEIKLKFKSIKFLFNICISHSQSFLRQSEIQRLMSNFNSGLQLFHETFG